MMHVPKITAQKKQIIISIYVPLLNCFSVTKARYKQL